MIMTEQLAYEFIPTEDQAILEVDEYLNSL